MRHEASKLVQIAKPRPERNAVEHVLQGRDGRGPVLGNRHGPGRGEVRLADAVGDGDPACRSTSFCTTSSRFQSAPGVSSRRAPHTARSGYVNERGTLLPGQQLRRPVRRPSVFADQPFAAAAMGSEQDAETSGDSVHLQIVDVEIERPGWSSAAGHAGEAIAR